MPILSVEIVGNRSDYAADLSQQLAEAAGVVLRSRPQGTWVRLSFVADDLYAENGGATPGIVPVIVTLLQSMVPSGDELQRQVRELTRAIAEVIDVPSENVHLIFEPSARGRVSFGGQLVE